MNRKLRKSSLDLPSKNLKLGASMSVRKKLRGIELVEINIEDDTCEIKKETTGCAELDQFGDTFLCKICGTAHSKNVACDDYGVFKTAEVFLCFNQKCGKIFESEIELEQHGNSCQETSAPPLSKTATFQDEDFNLLKTFSNMNKCNYCQKKFNTKVHFLQHMRIVHPDFIKCSLFGCTKFFRKQADFEEHRTKDHKEAVVCAICGKDYSSKSTIYLHILYKHLDVAGNRIGKTKCPHCCNFYKNVKLHAKLCHPDKIVSCSQSNCNRVFLTKGAMQTHSQKNHKPQIGNICQNNFFSKFNLQRHILEQHQETIAVRENGLTKCIHCGMIVRHILNHVRTKHPDRLLKCTQQFTSKSALMGHDESTHHGGWKGLEYKALGFKCVECRKYYCNKWSLNRHVQVHKTNTGLNCDLCKKTYFDKHAIRRHITQVHKFGAKTFKCHKCPMAYYELRPLKRHVMAAHGEIIM